ncbi:hypothetical protein PR048_020651 [Dryococelus australis]|uniref:Uncharacterized protein n=1 Tax=Dryococelus australis TaxID=614101 RepID=A0ABQ9H6V7_9NEOP|nr:hypothetical protein PR048_020651 [Dryococelus australis]
MLKEIAGVESILFNNIGVKNLVVVAGRALCQHVKCTCALEVDLPPSMFLRGQPHYRLSTINAHFTVDGLYPQSNIDTCLALSSERHHGNGRRVLVCDVTGAAVCYLNIRNPSRKVSQLPVPREQRGKGCWAARRGWLTLFMMVRSTDEVGEGMGEGLFGGRAKELPALSWTIYSLSTDEVAVAERLACSLPTKTNRVQSLAESPDFSIWEYCRTMPLVGGISRGSPVSPASVILALLHTHLNQLHRLLRPC